ncbi:MAG: tRNA preQ1(34) S-adenosylmethionine ribosyltransferase-isomerase QueA [Gammaproteobacteria bacterium]|nr:tRNA preQ1(34) S-adenosylmethionine ribosyltransferase-isomerase QueA [Gammaproteobacteria bacterium]
MRLSDFDYELPEALIAQFPIERRGDSRLLRLDAGQKGTLEDLKFSDLPQLLHPGDLLVFNDTRVMQARLFGHRASGGKAELLIERILQPDLALAHIRTSKSPKSGSQIFIGDQAVPIEVLGRRDDLFEIRMPLGDFYTLMEDHGHIPLPPYIQRNDQAFDLERYQTVYAQRPGAVAAPTAGLHFDGDMLRTLQEQGVQMAHITLHVGAGTFQPVRVEELDEHVMHSEYVEVNEQVCQQIRETQENGHRVVAVGTTSVRSLESASQSGQIEPFQGDTRLFIKPGYRFNCVDAMITNFHLPRSTLLMLVSAFSGAAEIRRAYRHAVAQRYRFFSYGDAMFLTRNSI